MALTSPRFRWNSRLEHVEKNSPVMRKGEQHHAVRLVQQSLIDLGFPMPTSTKKYGSPDGIYGSETRKKVHQYQSGVSTLSADGVVGKNTIRSLDAALPNASPVLPSLPARARYTVPGIKVVYDQVSPGHTNLCWAYSYTMLYSWKHGQCNEVGTLMEMLGNPWKTMYDNNRPIPASRVMAFAQATGLQTEPLACYTVAGWVEQLRRHGLIWIWQLNAGASFGHIRVLAGVTGDGSPDGSKLYILDPWLGRRYHETFEQFTRRYEGTAHASLPAQLLHW